MTDIAASARIAREKLAAALAVLQAPEAGDLVESVAGSVARAMGALHKIESTKGTSLPESGPIALNAVRAALASLQSAADADGAIVEEAMANVAGCLGLVHQLAQEADSQERPAPQAQPKAAQQTATEATAPMAQPAAGETSPAVVATAKKMALDATAAPATAVAPTERAQTPSHGAFDDTQLQAASTRQEEATPAKQADPMVSTQLSRSGHSLAAKPSAATAEASAAEAPTAEAPKPITTQESPSAPHQLQAQQEAKARTRKDSKHASPPSTGPTPDAVRVEASLGAHSPTNFYKGLSGNDVINDGGLFIATYSIPAIGTKLWVNVILPGGYEFEVSGEVRWTRESSAGGDAPPGFGVALESISQEARQLVYRYVRNREPLFHDDL